MTAPYAEITFVVEPIAASPGPPAPRFFCELCYSEARHNGTLRLSCCPVHGLASPLLGARPIGYARTHIATH